LLVPIGVYDTARQIESLTPLITAKNAAEIELMTKLVRENVNIGELLKD